MILLFLFLLLVGFGLVFSVIRDYDLSLQAVLMLAAGNFLLQMSYTMAKYEWGWGW